MEQRYWGYWDDIEDVRRDFELSPTDLRDEEVLFAYYDKGGYNGSAVLLFQRDGKVYEVSGSHCSCYGLEGSWDPDEVTWESLAVREFYRVENSDAGEMVRRLIYRHVPRA